VGEYDRKTTPYSFSPPPPPPSPLLLLTSSSSPSHLAGVPAPVDYSIPPQLPHYTRRQAALDRDGVHTFAELTDSLPPGDPAVLGFAAGDHSVKVRARAVVDIVPEVSFWAIKEKT